MAKTETKTQTSRRMGIELSVRVVLVAPPAGVQFSLGRTDDGKDHISKLSKGRDFFFDLELRARGGSGGEKFRMLGEHAHGAPDKRFIPIGVGELAGQSGSCWRRVIKVSLAGITPKLVKDAMAAPGARLVARVAAANNRGEPACATVPLLGGGWKVCR